MSERKAQPIIGPNQESGSLYAARKKLHVRATSGRFTNWRWFFVWATQLLYYGLPWLIWNDRQAVLFHLAERKFYIFGWVFWPQDVFYLAVLLIVSAYGLFLFTAIAGRLWCGYTCPQTVYTQIFMWVEARIEGDHVNRRKLDEAPNSTRKLTLRGVKYIAWSVVALWTGFTFVAYFTPLSGLLEAAKTLSFGGWEWFWILFYASFTFIFAGVLREQVCLYMCPYARFQGVMFDPDTLIVTYDERRGEPRGSRRKGVEPEALGKGDCIDCKVCVQVCPTGIDIREGLQHGCIGCAACVDACDDVMDKMEYPRGLIRFSTENALDRRWGPKEILRHVLRPRILAYAFILLAICGATAMALVTRPDIRLDIERDRATLAREVEGGMIENIYRLHVVNVIERGRAVEIRVAGIDGAHLAESGTLYLESLAIASSPVRVRVPHDALEAGVHSLYFEVVEEGGVGRGARERSTFIVPQ